MRTYSYRQYVLVTAVVIGFAFLTWHNVLVAPGHIYQNWDHATPPFSSELRQLASISQYAWNPLFDLGTSGVFSASNRWFDMFVRDGAAYLGGAWLAKWQGLLQMLIGAAGIIALCALMRLSWLPTLAATLLFTCNPKMYSLAITGHYQETGFALAFLPWNILLVYKSYAAPTFRRRAAAILAAGALGALICSASFFGIVYFASLSTLFIAAASLNRKSWRPLCSFAISGIIILLLHAYWLIPAMKSMADNGAIRGHATVTSLHNSYWTMYKDTSVPFAMALIGYSPNSGMGPEYVYPEYITRDFIWAAAAYALLLLSMTGLLRQTCPKEMRWFAGLTMLLGVILLAGNKTPLGTFLFETVLAKAPVLFYLMARTPRWMPLYYTGFAFLAAMGIQNLLAIVKDTQKWQRIMIIVCTSGLLCIYLRPYWMGDLTKIKFQSTQTWALMPQPIEQAEGQLAHTLTADRADYRITVWPTIADPKGWLPQPAHNAIESNFGFLGKDSALGPTSVGEPYSRFLLSLLHRRTAFTQHFGRLLGLAAIQLVVFDPSEPYLSYNDFGWMPLTNRIQETLFEMDNAYARFLSAQRDLTLDKQATTPPFLVYRNTDFLPRIRLAPQGKLAAGGMPLLASLADAPGNPLAAEALFFAADLSPSDVARLGSATHGLMIYGDTWPELLLPFLERNTWQPAATARAVGTFETLENKWNIDLRLDGSPLNAGGLVNNGRGSLSFPLSGPGRYHLFLRWGNSTPNSSRIGFSLRGHALEPGETAFPSIGCTWTDLGAIAVSDAKDTLEVQLPTPGTVVSGLLAVPEAAFETARGHLQQFYGRDVTLVRPAADASPGNSARLEPTDVVPLFPATPGVDVTMQHLRREPAAPKGGGTALVAGDTPGEVAFTLTFPKAVAGFTVETSLQLDGVPEGKAFVTAEYTVDGGASSPLFRIEKNTLPNRYSHAIPVSGRTLCLRFHLRNARLISRDDFPHKPMRVVARNTIPGQAALTFGQAVQLPATLSCSIPFAGSYRPLFRIIGHAGDSLSVDAGPTHVLPHDGATWIEGANRDIGTPQQAAFVVHGSPGLACDLMLLQTNPRPQPLARDDASLTYEREDPGRYTLRLPPDQSGYIVFSEAWHPDWRLETAGISLSPLKVFGFANAYPVTHNTDDSVHLVFQYQAIMERWLPLSNMTWLAILGLSIFCILPKK